MAKKIDSSKTRGVLNNNPGNIDRSEHQRWQGQREDQSADPRFVAFESPKWGIRAIARTLITYSDKYRLNTVRKIIDRWAPPVENDTVAYIKHVAELLNVGPDEEIDVYQWSVMKPLVEAIIAHECAGYDYDDATVDAALIAAGLKPPAEKIQSAKKANIVAKVSTAAGAVAATVPAVIATAPAAKQAYDQVVSAMGPVGDVVPWLPVALGVIGFAAVLIVGLRQSALAKLLKD